MAQEQLWENIARERLDDVFEPEMVKQYRLRRGEQCIYMPRFGTERYLCSCGTVNPLGKHCYVCGLEPEPLTREVVEELRREAQERLAQEKALQEQEEAERAARLAAEKKAKQKKRIRQIAVISASVLVLLAVAAVLFWFSTRVWIPAGHYQDGLEALAAGDLPQAHRSFTLAGNYKDAKDYLSRFYTPVLAIKRTAGHTISETVHTYDGGGRLCTSTANVTEVLDDGLVLKEDPTVWEITYDEAGRVLKREGFYGREEYTYNDRGDIASLDSYRTDGAHDSTRIFTYEYDDAGKLLQRAEICSELISVNYSYEQIDRYSYDEKGRVLIQTTHTNYPASIEASYDSETVNTYDDAGRLILREETLIAPNDMSGDCGLVEEWTYNSQGKVTRYCKTTVFPGEPMLDSRQVITTVYAEDGSVLEETTENVFHNDPSRNMVIKAKYTYDKAGNCLSEFHSQSYEDAQRQLHSGYTHTVENTYDFFGRLKECRVVWDHEDSVESYVQTEVFTYRFDGSPESSERVVKWRNASQQAQRSSLTYNENGLVSCERLVSEYEDSTTEYTYAYYYFPDGFEESDFISPETSLFYG